jgi:flagellar hook-basal body complex protein FliE
MSTPSVDSMIVRMQALAAAASGKPVATDNAAGNGVDFSAVLKNAIENVNTAQNSAQAKMKFSRLDLMTNRCIFVIMFL